MREIKFRAWQYSIKEMVNIQKMSFRTGAIMPYGWNIEYTKGLSGPMQYAGQNDINGNEVYEGDIVNQKSVLIGSPDIDFTGEVKFIDGSWCIDNGKDAVHLFNESCELKILGNKYEGLKD